MNNNNFTKPNLPTNKTKDLSEKDKDLVKGLGNILNKNNIKKTTESKTNSITKDDNSGGSGGNGVSKSEKLGELSPPKTPVVKSKTPLTKGRGRS